MKLKAERIIFRLDRHMNFHFNKYTDYFGIKKYLLFLFLNTHASQSSRFFMEDRYYQVKSSCYKSLSTPGKVRFPNIFSATSEAWQFAHYMPIILKILHVRGISFDNRLDAEKFLNGRLSTSDASRKLCGTTKQHIRNSHNCKR